MAKKKAAERQSAVPKGSNDDAAKKWLGLIEEGQKRERGWRKMGNKLIEIYEAGSNESDDEAELVPFNILYANTETLAPALFNSDPRPDTRARSKVENAEVAAAAGLVDAYLIQFIDSGDLQYSSYGETVSQALVEALVPGRGVVRFHYESQISKDEKGTPIDVIDERVFPSVVPWDKIVFGFARCWTDVPWISFEHTYTYDEAKERFGEKADSFTYEKGEDDDGARKQDEDGVELCTLFEVWCKVSRKIYWIEKAGKDFIKPPIDDPYKLAGFYPIQKPLMFFAKIKNMTPVPLYKLYKQQATELNRITRRITALIEAIKVRGGYDSQVPELLKIFEAEDNILVPITNAAALGQNAKLENGIWLTPIEKHMEVLRGLLEQRQHILQVIYQVMGIADIMRGSTAASETLGAQEIKNRWGTLRLKRAQKIMAEFVRDGLRIAAELAFSKMQEKNLRMLTGSTLPSEAQLRQAEAQVQALQAQAQQPQPGAQGGQPPQPPQIPPELQNLLAMPSFEACVQLLRSDVQRRYAIDIETNSTIDAEVAEDKENMADFLNALSQFLNGIFPLVEAGVIPSEVVKGIFSALSKRFRMGPDLDQYISKMGGASDQAGGMAKQKAALEKQGQELAKQKQQLEAEGQKIAKEKQGLAKQKMDNELSSMQQEFVALKTQLANEMKGEKQKAALEKTLNQIQAAMDRFNLMRQQAAAEERMEPKHADV